MEVVAVVCGVGSQLTVALLVSVEQVEFHPSPLLVLAVEVASQGFSTVLSTVVARNEELLFSVPPVTRMFLYQQAVLDVGHDLQRLTTFYEEVDLTLFLCEYSFSPMRRIGEKSLIRR